MIRDMKIMNKTHAKTMDMVDIRKAIKMSITIGTIVIGVMALGMMKMRGMMSEMRKEAKMK